jgi:peptidoglycan/xylan/chitin deacetylase (PgdA/CDA1 family)
MHRHIKKTLTSFITATVLLTAVFYIMRYHPELIESIDLSQIRESINSSSDMDEFDKNFLVEENLVEKTRNEVIENVVLDSSEVDNGIELGELIDYIDRPIVNDNVLEELTNPGLILDSEPVLINSNDEKIVAGNDEDKITILAEDTDYLIETKIRTDNYSNLPVSPIYNNSNSKNIALTFDIYGENGYTEDVLTVLRKRNIKSTIFVDVIWAFKNKELLNKILEDGHELAYLNKSDNYLDLNISDVIENDQLFFKTFAVSLKPFLRLNKISFAESMMNELDKDKFKLLFWSLDSEDLINQEEIVLKKLKQDTKAGDIVKMHLNSENALNVLPEYLRYLREDKELEIVRVSALLN